MAVFPDCIALDFMYLFICLFLISCSFGNEIFANGGFRKQAGIQKRKCRSFAGIAHRDLEDIVKEQLRFV